jgi:hypothetical protein
MCNMAPPGVSGKYRDSHDLSAVQAPRPAPAGRTQPFSHACSGCGTGYHRSRIVCPGCQGYRTILPRGTYRQAVARLVGVAETELQSHELAGRQACARHLRAAIDGVRNVEAEADALEPSDLTRGGHEVLDPRALGADHS